MDDKVYTQVCTYVSNKYQAKEVVSNNIIDKNIKVHVHQDEVKEIINEIKNIFKQNELNLIISSLSYGFDDLKTEVMNRWSWIIQKNSERITDSTERNLYVENEKKYLERKLDFLHKK